MVLNTFGRPKSMAENQSQLTFNAGVVGFGFIGEVHVRAIRASGGVVTSIAASHYKYFAGKLPPSE